MTALHELLERILDWLADWIFPAGSLQTRTWRSTAVQDPVSPLVVTLTQ